MRARAFFQSVYADNQRRKDPIKRKIGPDLLGFARNKCLRGAERRLIEAHAQNDLPVVFIVGVPRSGTTLLFQLMARFLDVGYPNLEMARHYMAPIWAAKRHQRRHGIDRQSIDFESTHGRTKGQASPHEFTWFWHYWLYDLRYYDDLTLAECYQSDEEGLRGELQGLAGFFERPFIWKSINFCSYQIDWLHQLLPNARFIHMKRDLAFTAQSIYLARQKNYGDVTQWWSSRPRDLHAWHDQSAEKQIAHQIFDIERSVQRGFELIGDDRHFTLDYESLVNEPHALLQKLAEFVGAPMVDAEILEALTLSRRNMQRIPDDVFQALKNELACP